MRISFDLDETLVCRQTPVLVEEGRWTSFLHLWSGEPLRRGTAALVHQLKERGCSVWIYTSSARPAFRIRLWLRLHGVRVDGVINEEKHRQVLSRGRFSRLPSKYPPAFGIDLHVDDSEGVRMEGQKHGFRVLVLRPEDEGWTQRVLNAVSDSLMPAPDALDPSSCRSRTRSRTRCQP